jgi:PleD family two-component response regulator
MTTRAVMDSRQTFHLTPTRIVLRHRLFSVEEQNVAHNSIRWQKCLPTDGHAGFSSATAEEPIQHMREARKPNRNWSPTQDEGIACFATHDPKEPCRVLVVDDDELILSRLVSLLQRSGYEAYAARSGEDAMRVLDEKDCQIVVTDWHMPDMDGLDLCRSIRSSADKASIYILMLTVRDGSGDIVAGLSAGADDYAVKGATAEEILARLEVGKRIT